MTILLLLAGLALSQDDAAVEGPAKHEARLTDLKGEVTLHTADHADGLPAVEGAPLQAGDRVVTGDGAFAELALDGEHVIHLRENSQLTINSETKGDVELSLAKGSLLAKIQKLLGGRLRVKTPTAVAAVRGTELAVEALKNETHVGVFDEGKVEVTAAGATETLLANQETSVTNGRPPRPAYYLRRHAKHRRYMRSRLRARPAALRKAWRSVPPAERQELRRKMIEKMVERRKQRAERRQELRRDRKAPTRDRRREQSEKDRLRRERLKERIRKGGRPQ